MLYPSPSENKLYCVKKKFMLLSHNAQYLWLSPILPELFHHCTLLAHAQSSLPVDISGQFSVFGYPHLHVPRRLEVCATAIFSCKKKKKSLKKESMHVIISGYSLVTIATQSSMAISLVRL